MEESKGTIPPAADNLKESVKRFIENAGAGDPQEMARELFSEDGELSEALIDAFPRLVSAAVQALKGFVESLESMPADKSAEMIAGSLSKIDGSELGEAANSLLRLLIRLYEQNPELFAEIKVRITTDAMKATDFGKLRKVMTYRIQSQLEYLLNETEVLLDDPVALINLFNLVSPYVTSIFKLLTKVFTFLLMPPEAMSYALLKILENIDWEEAGKAITAAAEVVTVLYRGDLILGDGSPQFKVTASRISEDLVRSVNWQEVSGAVAAIGVEYGVLVTSLANAALENEGFMLSATEGLVSVSNSSLKAASAILDKINALPPETTGKIAGGLAEDFDAQEMGRVLKSSITLLNRLWSENQESLGPLLKDTLSAADLDLSELVRSEAAGGAVNNALAYYNRLSRENPRLVEEAVDGFLSNLDPRQVGDAVRLASSQAAEAALRNMDVTRAVLKALLSASFKVIKGYVGNLRIFGRRRAKGV